MKKTLTEYDFCREWETNETRKNQFTHGGQKALYAYLSEYEDDTGEDIELDIVALCCDFTEYESAREALEAYSPDYEYSDHGLTEDEALTDDEREAEALEWLENFTAVMPFDYRVTLSDGTVIGDAGVIVHNF